MIRITEQVLRDGNQSLVTSRMKTEDILPVAPKLDAIGFHSLGAWSGSIFECCMRYLSEDPWERITKLKDHTPKTPLQVLMRAQNLFGYRIFSDEVVYKFTKYAVKNGANAFWIFDSLNDTRNMEIPIKAVKSEGAIAMPGLLYAINPVYTLNKFVQMGKELENYGGDFLSITDPAGILSPAKAFELVNGLKKELRIPLCIHCHCTTGMATMAYIEACRAGVDILETCISPFSGGVSIPPTESIVVALADTEYSTGYDLTLLNEIREFFSNLWKKYESYYNRRLFEINMGGFLHQLPSGMLSHLIFHLGQLGATDKFDAVLKEVPAVIKDLGYPPLATPSSQIVVVQSTSNVIMRERYKLISTELKNYVCGMYGNPPGEISEEIKEKVLGKNWEDKIISCRPADLLENEFEKAEEEAKNLGLIRKPEDVITYLFYPRLAKEFLSRDGERGNKG